MAGIEKDITNNNDFERVHNDSFPFYEYKTEIMPVNVLNGPKNPVITSNKQRGDLNLKQTSLNITANGTYTVEQIVPINKKWVFKEFNSGKTSGTFTISRIQFFLRNPSGTSIKIDDQAVSELTKFLGEQNLELAQDWEIESIITITGYSATGDVFLKTLYQEFEEVQ